MVFIVVLSFLLAFVSDARADVQNKDQVACIRTLTKDAVKVGKLQGKANLVCLKSAGKGESAGMAQECLTADASGRVSDAVAATVADDTDRCMPAPDFAYATGTEAAGGAQDSRLDAFGELFGADLDASATACATSADGCACQSAVAKAAENLLHAQWKAFADCQKSQIDAATSAADIVRCVIDVGTPASIAADTNGKIAKAGNNLFAAVTQKCDVAGVTSASFAQGSCAGLAGSAATNCMQHRMRCRSCTGIVRANDLTIDCDTFDDGTTNASCSSAAACNPLAAPGMQGCGAGEKCTWVTVSESPEPVGELACVVDGTVAPGGACMQGAAGETTGFDNCAAGGICISGSCVDVCGFNGSPNASCISGEACARFAGLGANGEDEPVMGACLATCDPLHQTRLVEGMTQSCGVNRGCYLLIAADNTIAVCAPAGTPKHNEPITGETWPNSCAPGYIPRQAVQGVSGNECAGFCKPADVFNGSNDGRSGRPDYEGGDSTETNWMTPAKPATCESAGGASVLPSVPTTGESCSHLWTRESSGQLTAFSNTLGWCFNHANWSYDPNGADPANNINAYPRCINTTTGDVLPPVDPMMSQNDAIYFGCMSQIEPPGESVGLSSGQPKLDRLGFYR